ncbi:apoptosis inducing factor [Cochliomyia hominivorax]
MSICSLRGINLQFSRRAFLLGNRRFKPVTIEGDTVIQRWAHNTIKKDDSRPKFSYNSEVLRAANCNRKNIDTQKEKDSSFNGEKKDLRDHSDKKDSGQGQGDKGSNTNILLALAAVLGIGGVAFYFLKGDDESSKKEKETLKVPLAVTKPASSQDLPKHVPYLLIGGGTAAFSAFRAIKSNDARAKVLMLSEENRNPYMRPPLSKELWYSAKETELTQDYRFKQWTGAERSLYFEPEEFFIDPSKLLENEKGGIAVAHGFKVKKIDPVKQIAILSDGYEIGYDQCLIATGCIPKMLPVFSNAPPSVQDKVMVYRTPDDFERLKRYVDDKKKVAIIGNGFIGSELACSLAKYTEDHGKRNVYQIFPESANMSKVLPDYLSKWTMKKVESQGVCVLPNASVKSVTRAGSSLHLSLSTGETIVTDVVVVCVGCEANTDIASPSGLEVDNNLGGFVVNAELEARRNLFAAGDASCFYDPLLGRRRVEHHDHSVVSGRLAGENMVGKKKPYTHQSMFWSDLGPEIGYEGIGLVDSSLPTVGVFSLPSKETNRSDNLAENQQTETEIKETPKDSTGVAKDVEPTESDSTPEYGRGVVFYLKDDKIVGILLWNIFNRIGLARTIINQNKKYDDLNEVAKLFEIHS